MKVTNIHFTIDWIQSTKKQIVDATVADDRVRQGLHKFVDQQTALSKTVVDNYFDFTAIAFSNVFPKVKVD